MLQLNRSMMDRYEIADRRPQTLRAAIFGADQLMLGVAARLLDRVNENGGDVGAACITRAAAALSAQDCMFTLLVRGDLESGGQFKEERVVQSILQAVDPESDFDALLAIAARPELEMILLSENCDALELALAARFLHERMQAGLPAPMLILIGEYPSAENRENIREAVIAISANWRNAAEFAAWLRAAEIRLMLAESLSGLLNAQEAAKARRDMNYRDDFIAWAEPQLKCTADGALPNCMAGACAEGDFAIACAKKARIFDAAVFLCAALGYLSGMDSFAQTLRDERLRDWIGHAFFDEILPALPYPREEIAQAVISAFGRLENSMNDMPLMEIGRGMLGGFGRTLLPAIRAYAEREFEAPPRLSLALSAAIMIYAGARKNDRGEYEILRGDARQIVQDRPDILEAYSALAHDMPAESLAYAVLADRAIWGGDLREIDGLELRLCMDLSSIQRVGLRETLRLQAENLQNNLQS